MNRFVYRRFDLASMACFLIFLLKCVIKHLDPNLYFFFGFKRREKGRKEKKYGNRWIQIREWLLVAKLIELSRFYLLWALNYLTPINNSLGFEYENVSSVFCSSVKIPWLFPFILSFSFQNHIQLMIIIFTDFVTAILMQTIYFVVVILSGASII